MAQEYLHVRVAFCCTFLYLFLSSLSQLSPSTRLSISLPISLAIAISLPTEYTELQPLLSGVHSVMRVKLALAGKGGGCTPTPSH
jgi:hypothetical protein